MSKYIELSRALMYIADIQLSVSDASKPTIAPRDLCEWIFEGIKDLPTIEVSEEVTRPFEYFDGFEDGKASVEVSEDCISREWVKGICENMLDEEMLGHMLGYIEDAPSVTTEQSSVVRCKDCTHYHAFKDYAYCTVINVKGKHPQPNDYCSYAEEK